MWQRAEGHPVLTWLVFCFLALVVVDGSRRTLAVDPTPTRAWPLWVFAGLATVCCTSFAIALKGWQRSAAAFTPVLLALAWAPVVIGLGAAFAGAPLWVLWVSSSLSFALAGCWVRRVRAGIRDV